MMLRLAFSDVLAKIASMHAAEESTWGDDDLFVCTLGFEARCLAGPALLTEQGYRSRDALVFEYPIYREHNERNLPELTRHLNAISTRPFAKVPYDMLRTPQASALALADHIESLSEPTRKVTIDITSCTSSLIMQALRELFRLDVDLRVIYTEAETYYPLKGDWDRHRLEWDEHLPSVDIFWGLETVSSAPGFTGRNPSGAPILLIAYPGFKRERVGGIIHELQPAKTVWLIGIASTPDRDWRMQAMGEINQSLMNSEAEKHRVPTYDHKPVLEKLEELYQKYSLEYAVTIAGTGTKLQSVATVLFSLLHSDVAVVFSIPKSFNPKRYTEDHRQVYEIAYGSTAQVLELFRQYKHLSIPS